MKNNYTGLIRNPSSLTWLIKQRETIKGSINRKQRRIKSFRGDISSLQRKLKAVDTVISVHEISLDPNSVQGRAPQRKRLARRGEMGKFLLAELKKVGEGSITTTDLTVRFLGHIGTPLTMLSLKDARTRISWRLKDLASEGRIVGRHTPDERGVYQDGEWSLAIDLD